MILVRTGGDSDVKNSVALAIAAMLMSSPAAAAYEFYVKVKAVARDAPAGPIFLLVTTSKDLDGDGANDEGTLRMVCTGRKISSLSFQQNVKSPRDAASGQAAGRMTGVRSWQPASRELSGRKIKLVNATVSKLDQKGWTPVTLDGAKDLCKPAIDAMKATKSRSNIQNN
jgi:hypothetical protein